MNLKALNTSVPWDQLVENYFPKYKSKITFGDQCLLNAILHFHPGIDTIFVFIVVLK